MALESDRTGVQEQTLDSFYVRVNSTVLPKKMAKRQKLKERIFYKEEEKLMSVAAMTSDDDDEANTDFNLSIVEKHLLMRAAKLCHDDGNNNNTDVVVLDDIVNMNDSIVVAGPSGATDDVVVVEDATSDKKKIRVRKRKKTKEEIGDHSVTVAKEEQKVEAVDNGDDGVMAVEISDNIVLRKLLRGPRYFDPPDRGWQTCYNCGEEGHMAVNCTSSVKRKKPCFICGSSDHGVRQCSKAQDCFICKKGGHRAKDCPDKHSRSAKVCLKCGDCGHDMFTCGNSYSLDDLKDVQCYICKSFGHLCCINVADAGPREVSCFRCGQLGHTGLACSRSRGENAEASPSSCYKCGGEGHFAYECVSSAKVHKWNIDTSSPILRPHGENKDYSGVKSAPHDLGNARKKKKTQHEERGVTTPQKSKQRGGWITDETGGIFFGKPKTKRNHWSSPGTPPSNGHKILALTSGGHFSSPQSSKEWTPHHTYSASRFNNLWQ